MAHLTAKIKVLCVYSIKFHLRKFVKFDDTEQKWYSKNYPDDPSLVVDKKTGKQTRSRSRTSDTKNGFDGRMAHTCKGEI